jgi:hypothetical protein
MAKNMGNYCKAYPVSQLRRYPKWTEKTPPLHAGSREPDGSKLSESSAGSSEDSDYVYLHEDYTVTAGIFLNENLVFDEVSEEWRSFCEQELGFRSPSFSTSVSE